MAETQYPNSMYKSLEKKRFESSALPSQGTAICSCRSRCPKPGSAIRAWMVLILLINKELEES